MFDDNDQDALAAEYVLGTLSPNERDQAEALLTIDPGFAAIVRQWESRLGELNVMVEAVEPPPAIWDRIKAQIGGPSAVPFNLTEAPRPVEGAPSFPAPAPAGEAEQTPPMTRPAGFTPLDQTPPPPPPAPELQDVGAADMLSQLAILASRLSPSETEAKTEAATTPAPPAGPEPSAASETAPPGDANAGAKPPEAAPDDLESPPPPPSAAPPPLPSPLSAAPPRAIEHDADVIDLTARMRRWRGLTLAAGALAAALAVYIALTRLVPGIVPPNSAGQQAAAPQPAKPPPSRLVAALQREPVAPAFLVTVDSQSKTLTVRRLAAAPDPGKSYELWIISKQTPHSLGIVGKDEFTQRPLPANLDVATMRAASYAVSLEPAGGSPSGVPTGPVLFTGKLVESMPGAPPG